ncbi:helix-turn-helix domain-containing protein [Niabella ginsengisoli]|uniref:AraC family transcriptional regulator n=1 Tax=Niabella ginsengisoli TaxID=522298 RepID=A0ABS9SI00_9BACT|nr:AraC family transcriptional regulator [Niabella ginsengisoli]MCH5597998.1 AraC family transcriptional regulator [Niabella ginsengisoli]
MVVNTVGFESISANTIYPVQGHPRAYSFFPEQGRRLHEYQIIYFVDGEGSFKSASTAKTKIESGHVAILFPGQWHTYHPCASTGWKVFYIGFEGAMIDNILAKEFISFNKQILNVGFSETLVDLFKRAIEIAKEDSLLLQQRLAGIAFNIVTEALFLSNKRMSEKEQTAEVIEKAKAIMYENYNNDIDLENLSEKLCSSYSWFRKVFKKYTGYAPAHYFQEIKIRKAKEFLLETDMSIKEIAYELNYQSYEYFISRFKKHTGVTPVEYKKQSSFGL